MRESKKSAKPSASAISQVVSAFTTAGIALHIDATHEEITHVDTIAFGMPSAFCALASKADFYAVKAAHFDPKRALAYRYMVSGHFVNCDSVEHCQACEVPAGGGGFIPAVFGTAGAAELPGNDLIITFDPFNYGFDLFTQEGIDERDRFFAGTILHELGHGIGLRHGGGLNAPNKKPNYLSVMSYRFQFTGVPTAGIPRIDLSGAVLATLDEAHLNETLGIQDGTDSTTYFCPALGEGQSGPGTGAINWNCDGDSTDTDVAVDINGDGTPGQVLTGYDDWANLDHAFQCAPTFEDGVPGDFQG